MAGYSVTYSVVDNATKQIDGINRRITAMRAPMERLSKQVSRFVDVSGLNTIAKGFASIGRAALGVLRTLTEMVPVLGTITGAATIAGMAKLVGSYANWSKQLTSTADNLGMTTQQLQQFEDATRLAGGKTSDMDEALKALYKTQTDFVRGQASADQIGWLNRLGISVKDANGNLRDMTDLMPEVVRKISEIKNPADRAAASAALLGDANLNLVNTFRQSHQSFMQWLTDASRYTELSDKQKDQLQAFSEAQGRIGTAFDHLGQQISATLAQNFTPLLNTLAEFVEKHTPEIIAAVDHISAEFTNWINGVDWNQVKEDIKGIVDVLRIMLDVAEAIGKAFQKTLLMFGLVNRKFTKEDVLQNSPFYAQLDPEQQKQVRQQVGIGEEDYAKGQQPQPGTSFTAHPLDWLSNRVLRGGKGNEGYQTPTGRGPAPSQQPAQAAPGPTAPASPAGPPPTQAEQQENLRRAMDEQGVTDPEMRAGIGAIAAGEGGFKPRSEDSYAGTSNERIRGIFGGHVSDLSDAQLTQLKANPEAFFNKVYGGRLGNATDEGYKYRGRGDFQLTGKGNYERYGKMIGVDLVNNPDLVNDPAVSAKISVAYMKDRYHGGGFEGMKRAVGNPVAETEAIKNAKFAEYHRTGEFAKPAAPAPTQVAQATPPPAPAAAAPPTQVAQASPPPVAAAAPTQVAQAAAPPAAVPSPTAANGKVDVNITGKNLPPNTAITASATGPGVSAPPPRVERQELASI